MKKKLVALSLMATMMMSLTACGTSNNNGTGSTDTEDSAAANGTFRVAMVTDTGGVNDQSFNTSAWEGLTELSNTYDNVEASYIESTQEADYASNLDKMVDNGNDLVWGVGFAMADAVSQSASMNPDQLYGIIDHEYEEAVDNVACVMFKAQEPSFMVGYAAGLTTETDKVGFVGGISSAIIDQFEYGFRAGVAYAAQELGKDIEVTVQYAESFGDAAIGKAIATKMYTAGCDIVFHAAGNVGVGVIEAAKDTGNYAIGVDRDQSDLAPDNVLTSALKRVDTAIQLVSEEAMNGNEIAGQTFTYGSAEGAVGIPEDNPNMSDEVYEKTIEIQQLIIDGTIVAPYDSETLETFLQGLE